MEKEDLLQQKSELINKKYEYINKVTLIEKEIKRVQEMIYENCKAVNNGHEWIREREEGPYGETFFYCKYCDCGR